MCVVSPLFFPLSPLLEAFPWKQKEGKGGDRFYGDNCIVVTVIIVIAIITVIKAI